MSDTPIHELFARDPLHLSNQDVDQIIAHLRENRRKFLLGNMNAGKPEAKKSAATKKGEAVAKAVGPLNDLLGGLDL